MPIVVVFVILPGILIAGIINYLSDVLPQGDILTQPVCKVCNSPYDLSSYLLFLKCPSCSRNRSLRSWFILVIVPLVYLYLWIFPTDRLDYWMAALIFSYLCLVVVIDIEHHLILQIVTIYGLLIAVPSGILLHGLLPTLYGGLTGLGIMFVLYLLGIGFIHIVCKIKKKPYDDVALGFGDVSLSFLLGLILGFPGIIGAILIAILIGGIYSLLFMVGMLVFNRYKPLKAIPYAPFLALSALILLFR